MKDATEWDFSYNGWVAKVFVKDLIFGTCVAAGWYWYTDIYNADVLKPVRFNQIKPDRSELYREIPYTYSTILIGAILECLVLHLYGNGTITTHFENYWDRPWVLFFWVVLCPLWRDSHFYWVHRLIHPWNTEFFPDIGYYLFKYGHYIHHQSTNITAWSGLSMHPIEGFVLETAFLVPLFFTHHPVMLYIVKCDLNYKATVGHDGYDFPG